MHKLRRRFDNVRLFTIVDGARYQAQQTDLWKKNRETVRIQQMLDDVNQDPLDLARHQINVNENVRAWELAHPGEDSHAYRRKLEGIVADNCPKLGKQNLMRFRIHAAEIKKVLRFSRKALKI